MSIYRRWRWAIRRRDPLWRVLKVLPTDYAAYGGEVKRWEHDDVPYPDCSCGCAFFNPLAEPQASDWGVCSNPRSPRAGLLTWEHQAGHGCFAQGELVDPLGPAGVRGKTRKVTFE